MTSQILQLEKLNNTRDLYGITTRDGGRIKAGKLFRSGHLYGAGERDIEELSGRVGLVVDLRTKKECEEKPDPVIPGVERMHLPVLQSLSAGITWVKETEDAVTALSRDPATARNYMTQMYISFVTNEFTVAQYGRFLDVLDKQGGKTPVLWHCTAGKDRVGFAAVLVQEILGVTRDDIFEDYLVTNHYLQGNIEALVAQFRSKRGGSEGKTSEADDALLYLFSAKEEYLAAVYQKVDEMYGSFGAFLETALRMDRPRQERLRKQYLE